MEPPFQPPILSYEDINGYAENFLKTHSADDKLPVPIEEIVDLRLGINHYCPTVFNV